MDWSLIPTLMVEESVEDCINRYGTSVLLRPRPYLIRSCMYLQSGPWRKVRLNWCSWQLKKRPSDAHAGMARVMEDFSSGSGMELQLNSEDIYLAILLVLQN